MNEIEIARMSNTGDNTPCVCLYVGLLKSTNDKQQRVYLFFPSCSRHRAKCLFVKETQIMPRCANISIQIYMYVVAVHQAIWEIQSPKQLNNPCSKSQALSRKKNPLA